MGSIHDAASTSSASSSSSMTYQENSPSTSRRKPYLSATSVAALRSRFEGLSPPAADERMATGAINSRRNSGDVTSGSSEVVDDRKSKRRSTAARPNAASRSTADQRSVGAAGSTPVPVNRAGRRVITVCKRGKEPELITAQDDRGNQCLCCHELLELWLVTLSTAYAISSSDLC